MQKLTGQEAGDLFGAVARTRGRERFDRNASLREFFRGGGSTRQQGVDFGSSFSIRNAISRNNTSRDL